MKEKVAQLRPHPGTVAGGILAVLITVYFLCPPILEIPVYIWFYHRYIPSSLWGDLATFYAPLGRIGRKFPMYMKLLNSEEALFMKLGQRDPAEDKVIGDE